VGARVLDSRPRGGPGGPDVADTVDRRPGRRPARKDHIELRGLIVARGLADVTARRQPGHLPGPRQIRKLAQLDDHVAMDRERGALAVQPRGEAAVAANELDCGVAYE